MSLIFENDLGMVSWFRLFFCILFGSIFFYVEVTKKYQLSYSKFNESGNLDSKKGMLFIYFLPLLTYIYFYWHSNFTPTFYHQMVLIAVSIHFAKRCLESLFLHRYSGKISIVTTFFIAWAYSSIAYTIHESVNLFTKIEKVDSEMSVSIWIGFLIFLLGQSSNLYHHILLTKLRASGSKEYKIPEGGLFKYVNCPHYLSEIIGWIGIAIMSRYLIVFGLTYIMSAYLVARSINTTKWYQEKIPNYPRERKSILPFVL
ncbi:MAG TPA: DUF1295 domain-containing protein [Leptospiraceae bacterium]|nr:DUF1295 domain-containing protein [Leptospiraceae bacterium]HMW06665.1 DUF1295 domain-containing protein [Leptospiraceae bacterium]HMX34653.1 DUF1295 domain-containing protein [Leptospiraceae bacterium]HMY33716.1 DUF1295 domain-containing protein [Leptospiraceae bacterium]HMZ66189.1 DUF1295 domain-containing protein [Leptospiraceae bacterium]